MADLGNQDSERPEPRKRVLKGAVRPKLRYVRYLLCPLTRSPPNYIFPVQAAYRFLRIDALLVIKDASLKTHRPCPAWSEVLPSLPVPTPKFRLG